MATNRRRRWPLRGRPALGTMMTRVVVFSVLWWILTQGDLYAWWFGVVVIAIATVASIALLPAMPWRLRGVLRFVPFFVHRSIVGGVDVARRALSPSLPIDPTVIELPTRLTAENARVLCTIVMSLLPGTVSVELKGSVLRLHVLDRSMPVEQTFHALEERIAALYGDELALDARTGTNR